MEKQVSQQPEQLGMDTVFFGVVGGGIRKRRSFSRKCRTFLEKRWTFSEKSPTFFLRKSLNFIRSLGSNSG